MVQQVGSKMRKEGMVKSIFSMRLSFRILNIGQRTAGGA